MTTLMKDSGIDWVGEIPKGWEIKRVKDIVNLRGGGIDKKIIEGEKIVNLVNFTDVFKLKKLDNNLDYMQVSCREDKISNVSLIKNDLLITPSSETAKEIGIVNIVLEDLINSVYSYHILRMRLKDKKNFAKFLYYYFNSKFSKFQFENKALGITRVTLSRGDINENILFVPPLETQQKIAEYLDVEVSKLDKQVSLLERKYALLGDYKDALIFETVTQGLDKAVPMKDSGIDWIGQIPEGWKVKRLKEISVLKKGEVFNSEKSKKDGLYPYINGGINPSDYSDEYNVLENNIAVSEGGASAGYSQFVKTKFWAGSHCYVIKPKNGNIKKYMYYILKGFSGQIMFEKTGSAMPNLQKTKFSNFLVSFVENLETQQKIADYLDVEVEKLDKQRELIKRKVELLKEYKEALIFEVVTGKKEVK